MMNLLILQTNISSKRKAGFIREALKNDASIKHWSIDVEDIDNVLRVETDGNLSEIELMKIINETGFECEPLS